MRRALTGHRFCAAGPAESVRSFSADHRHLDLSGKVIDTFIYRAATLDSKIWVPSELSRADPIHRDDDGTWIIPEVVSDIHATFQVLRAWVDVSTWYGQYSTGETAIVALQRTLVYDEPEDPTNSGCGLNGAFDAWYKVMRATDTELMAISLGVQGKSVEDLRAIMRQLPEEGCTMNVLGEHDVWTYLYAAMAYSNKKCLFTTENDYMGTAPDMIRPDDRIAVIAGICMPLVLRPADSRYQLVTHAYVHGAMYGDAWPDYDDELEEIALI